MLCARFIRYFFLLCLNATKTAPLFLSVSGVDVCLLSSACRVCLLESCLRFFRSPSLCLLSRPAVCRIGLTVCLQAAVVGMLLFSFLVLAPHRSHARTPLPAKPPLLSSLCALLSSLFPSFLPTTFTPQLTLSRKNHHRNPRAPHSPFKCHVRTWRVAAAPSRATQKLRRQLATNIHVPPSYASV